MYLSTLQEKHQTKAFKKYFAFFAFNKSQLKEQININFKYVNLGGGLLCPVEFHKKLYDVLQNINKKAIAEHQRLESKKDIIWSAFGNYEIQITGDLTDVIESLEGYDITKEEIIKEYNAYYKHCIDNDYF